MQHPLHGSSVRRAPFAVMPLLAAAACTGLLAPVATASTTWTNYTTSSGLGNNVVWGVYASGSTIYAATNGGLSVSSNNGTSWTNYTTSSGLGSNAVLGVYASGSTIYAATAGGLSVGVTAAAVPGTGVAGLAAIGLAGITRRRRR